MEVETALVRLAMRLNRWRKAAGALEGSIGNCRRRNVKVLSLCRSRIMVTAADRLLERAGYETGSAARKGCSAGSSENASRPPWPAPARQGQRAALPVRALSRQNCAHRWKSVPTGVRPGSPMAKSSLPSTSV
jgi:hypothetical protein